MTRLSAALAGLRSRRALSVVALSFSSGLPLGLVWYAIPDWMRDIGVDIRIVGLFNLAQIPWAFKILWSPFMDRFVPGFWGRRRGWMAVTQVALLACCLLLGGAGDHPDAIWVVGALALAVGLAAASQDIVLDAYAVEVLLPEEQGAAVGARIALYRAAMLVAGGGAISLAAQLGWGAVNALLGLLFLPMLLVTWRAPEPEGREVRPKTLADAVWQPFLEALSRPRALEILAFVFFYKFADNLAQALTRPFLVDMGYGANHRGVALGTVGLAATVFGAFAGGIVTTMAGLGPSLWLFGGLQIFSNLGYYFVAGAEGSLAWMYGATAFELLTSGLGTGAFSVLLLRITERSGSRRPSTRSSPACSPSPGSSPGRSPASRWTRSAGAPSSCPPWRWGSRDSSSSTASRRSASATRCSAPRAGPGRTPRPPPRRRPRESSPPSASGPAPAAPCSCWPRRCSPR